MTVVLRTLCKPPRQRFARAAEYAAFRIACEVLYFAQDDHRSSLQRIKFLTRNRVETNAIARTQERRRTFRRIKEL